MSALSGTLTVFTASGLSTPAAYQPTAAWALTMNMAVRSIRVDISFTRWVNTSDRFEPFSMLAIEARSDARSAPPAPPAPPDCWTASAMAAPISSSSILSS